MHLKICTPSLISKCLKDDMQQSLLCGQRQTSCCTAKPAMTAARNVVMLVSLFCSWVCLLRPSSAPWLDSTSVWKARRCVSIFPIIVLPFWKAAHQRVSEAYTVTTVTHADESAQSSDVWMQQIQSDRFRMTAWPVCIRNQIWETKWKQMDTTSEPSPVFTACCSAEKNND